MAFGQASGPPATARQIRELLDLLEAAGHSDFRDARGPLGFTQRQAGGKFTRDEADEFIEQLTQEQDEQQAHGEKRELDEQVDPAPPITAPVVAARPKASVNARDQQLRSVSSEALAAELQRRGWVVMEP